MLAGAAVVGFVIALALVRHLAADEEYVVADASFEPQVAADRLSTAEPAASAPTTPNVRAAATPPVTAAVMRPSIQPTVTKQAAAETTSTPAAKVTKTVTVPLPAATTVEKPVVNAHEPEAPAASAVERSAVTISAPPVAATTAATVDEVTITGCLEIAKDEDRFRLSDTEGANAPKARSWRSGFFKKRSASVDLIGSTEGLSRQVGQRVAATGVLSSRTLKIGTVRVVGSSCN